MKRFSLTFISLAIASVAVIMFACKKENEPQNNNNGNPAEVAQQQNSEVVKRIVDFNKKVQLYRENPAMKSSEAISIEEAKADIVDLFNVTYTEPMEYYSETAEHDFSITLPLTADGKVLLDNVVSAYEDAIEAARAAYHSSPLTDKGYQRLLASFEERRDGTVTFNFNGKFGTKNATPPTPQPHIYGPFAQGDDWYYKNGMGNLAGTLPGGADIVLRDTIMKEVRASWPADPRGCRGFYEYYDPKYFSGPNIGTFYRADDEANQTVIYWYEMNDYLAGEKNVVFNMTPDALGISLGANQAQNYINCVTDVQINGNDGFMGGIRYIEHETIIYCGRYHYIDNAVIEQQQL